MALYGDATPRCSICVENLGKYGGPSTLPCGHNYCLQCLAAVQHAAVHVNPECPLCRAPFPRAQPLSVNTELRDLITLARALNTVEHDGWETVTATKGKVEGEDEQENVTLMPTAPPLRISLSTVLEGQGDLLSLEPPKWLPDSHAQACGLCKAQFRALRRSRHHCRLCGAIFCQACCNKRLLLPPKFQQAQPQRICEPCAVLLEPLQPFLAGTISKAVQPAVHDVTDPSAMRSWFNAPLSGSLEGDIYKATNIVRAFARTGTNMPERHIPASILQDAAGFAVLSTVKVGMGWSGMMGTGLVVGRREGAWSAPAAIALAGVGWGFQVGGAVSDILIVLRNRQALHAFCGKVHLGGGVGASLALGPMGRQAEAALRVGTQGGGVCYSYSCSSGVFAGISIEGSAVSIRDEVNLSFYGRPVTARQLLLEEKFAAPVAAEALYTALDDLLTRVGAPTIHRSLCKKPIQPQQRDFAHHLPNCSPQPSPRVVEPNASPDHLRTSQYMGMAALAEPYASPDRLRRSQIMGAPPLPDNDDGFGEFGGMFEE